MSPVNFQYANSSVNGRYGFSQFGSNISNNTLVTYSGSGTITTNGAGSITTGSMTQRTSSGLTCSYSVTGTYSVSANGSGTATLNGTLTGNTNSQGCTNSSATFAIFVTQQGSSLVWSQTDNSGWAAGQALKQ
jgi:hypothetical protein